jgi:DNA-binding NtrC family response regulator
VETAKSAADAMALLEKQEFDVVVADLDLSGTAERNILQDWIAARRPALTKRCVWMRGVSGVGLQAGQTPSNGDYILQKPFKAAELLSAVDRVLGGVQVAPIQS